MPIPKRRPAPVPPAAALLTAALLALAASALAAGPAAAIVGGSEAPPGGAVMVLSAGGGVCTGVVLAPGAVLTAAHCAAPGREHRVHFRDAEGRPVLVEVADALRHPGYDAGAVAGRRRSIDLALLRTAAPLPERFAPVTLSAATPRAGETLALSGYGAARPGDPRSTGTYRSVGVPVVEPHGPSRVLVWLRADGAGRASAGGCQGDSGGPIAGPDGAVLALAAWVGGACGGLTQGVLVGPQRAWIDHALGGWGLAARWAD